MRLMVWVILSIWTACLIWYTTMHCLIYFDSNESGDFLLVPTVLTAIVIIVAEIRWFFKVVNWFFDKYISK